MHFSLGSINNSGQELILAGNATGPARQAPIASQITGVLLTVAWMYGHLKPVLALIDACENPISKITKKALCTTYRQAHGEMHSLSGRLQSSAVDHLQDFTSGTTENLPTDQHTRVCAHPDRLALLHLPRPAIMQPVVTKQCWNEAPIHPR